MNYQIIGGDGQEYGPVPEPTIREWIADGRLDNNSRIRAEGSADWSTVGALPEFSATLATAAPTRSAGGSGRVDIGICLSTAFGLFQRHWLALVLACLVFVVLSMAIGIATSLLSTPATMSFQAMAQGAPPDIAQLSWQVPLYLLCIIVNILITTLLYAGGLRFLIRIVRGADPNFVDIFAAFRERTLPVMLVGLLSALVCLVGYLLCVLPGIYLQVGYIFAPLIALEKNVGVWEAIESSRRAIHSQWWQMFALVILMIAFSIAGLLLCGVGILAAYPICGLMFAKAYCDLFDTGT